MIAETPVTLDEISKLTVGSTVINCFGHEATVTRVFARGTNNAGKSYVCVYAADNGLVMSASFVEGDAPVVVK